MNLQKSERQHRKMTEDRIPSLILRLSAPTTVGMIVTALYSLADAFFVSELGTEASAAVGVTFAIQALVQAVGYTLGLGAGSMISRALGSRKDETAGTLARVSFHLANLAGLLIMLAGVIWCGPIVRFLGATESIYPYARNYAFFLFLSVPFMCTAFVISQLLRAEGKAIYSMVGLSVGSVLNIILDPIMIKTFRLGVAGASVATLISQFFSLCVLLSAYVCRQSQIRLFEKVGRRDFLSAGRILVNGLPSTFRQGLTVLATILLNRAAGAWSDAAVASISVVARIFLLAFSFCLGIGQGMMPVVGYNYGFDRQDRVRHAYLFSVILSTASMFLISIPVLIWAPSVIVFFRRDAEVIAIGTTALRAQCYAFALHGLITCTIMMLQAIGKQFAAALLACARQGLFFLPLIFWLPSSFGIGSVIYVQPLADGSSFLFAVPFFFYALKQVRKKKKEAVALPA